MNISVPSPSPPHLVVGVDEVLAAAGDAGLPAADPRVCPGVARHDVEAVAGAGLGHLPLQQPLVARVQPRHQTVRLLLEVVREPPVRLPGEGSGVRIRVGDPLLDGVLEQGDVLLQGVGGPGVEHDVQELADVAADVLALAGGLAADDGDEAWAEGVLEDELEADDAAGGHHLGAVLDQVDQRRQQKLQEPVHLRMKAIEAKNVSAIKLPEET